MNVKQYIFIEVVLSLAFGLMLGCNDDTVDRGTDGGPDVAVPHGEAYFVSTIPSGCWSTDPFWEDFESELENLYRENLKAYNEEKKSNPYKWIDELGYFDSNADEALAEMFDSLIDWDAGVLETDQFVYGPFEGVYRGADVEFVLVERNVLAEFADGTVGPMPIFNPNTIIQNREIEIDGDALFYTCDNVGNHCDPWEFPEYSVYDVTGIDEANIRREQQTYEYDRKIVQFHFTYSETPVNDVLAPDHLTTAACDFGAIWSVSRL